MPELETPLIPADGVTPPTDDNAGLKKALDAERHARKEAEKALKARDQADTDSKAAHDKAEMERKGEWEKLKLTVEAEKKALQDEKEKATNGRNAYILKAELLAAIGDNSPHLLKQIEDEFEVVIAPDGTSKVLSKDGGKTPAQHLEAMKADPTWGAFFKGSGVNGGGSGPVGKPAPGVKSISRTSFDQLSPMARIAHTKGGGTVTD